MADTFSSYEEEYVAIRDAINKALSNDEGDDAQAGGAQQRGGERAMSSALVTAQPADLFTQSGALQRCARLH